MWENIVEWPLGDDNICSSFIVHQVKPVLGILSSLCGFLHCFLAAKRGYWVQTQMWTDEATGSSAETAGTFF